MHNIDSQTRVYGIIGNPVGHSLSPLMHNLAFQKLNINAVYTAFPVTDVKAAIDGIRALNIAGLSVTIPHKTSVIDHLDSIDPIAEKMDAVNTIINENGQLKGYNTDGIGAYKAVLERIPSLDNKNVFIIGNGGTAKAIAYTLLEKAKLNELILLGRNENRLAEFVSHLNEKINFKNISAIINSENEKIEEALNRSQVIINTTPVGMSPDDEGIPIPEVFITNKHIVFDAVYKPLETRLLKAAKDRGAITIDGLEMLINQGIAQFEIWTSQKAPKEAMSEVIRKTMI